MHNYPYDYECFNEDRVRDNEYFRRMDKQDYNYDEEYIDEDC